MPRASTSNGQGAAKPGSTTPGVDDDIAHLFVSWFNRGDAEIAFLSSQHVAVRDAIDHWHKKQRTVRRILANHMEVTEQRTLPGRVHCIGYRKGALGVELLDPAAIPQEYRRIKTTETIDKTAIRRVLDNFGEVPGAALVEGPSTVVVR